MHACSMSEWRALSPDLAVYTVRYGDLLFYCDKRNSLGSVLGDVLAHQKNRPEWNDSQ